MHCDCFKNFEDLIFEDDKLFAKTVKITSLENLYVYGNCDCVGLIEEISACTRCLVQRQKAKRYIPYMVLQHFFTKLSQGCMQI